MGALTYPEGPTVQKRRSDRVFIRIPVSIHGTDQNGHDFGNRALTQTVARFGASIVTNLFLFPEQELTLIPASRKPIRARVIGQTSICPDGHVYGLAFLNTTSDSWGIHFPPMAEAAVVTIQMECCKCEACQSVYLNEIEFEVFRANAGLRRICSQCGDLTTWRLAEHVPARKPPRYAEPQLDQQDEQPRLVLRSQAPPPAEVATAQKPQTPKRRYRRLRMNLKACIAQPGSDDDVVNTINVSRGGILARSERAYPTDSWIQLAAPYTPAAANIFVPARIVWRAEVQGAYQYGIKYVSC